MALRTIITIAKIKLNIPYKKGLRSQKITILGGKYGNASVSGFLFLFHFIFYFLQVAYSMSLSAMRVFSSSNGFMEGCLGWWDGTVCVFVIHMMHKS